MSRPVPDETERSPSKRPRRRSRSPRPRTRRDAPGGGQSFSHDDLSDGETVRYTVSSADEAEQAKAPAPEVATPMVEPERFELNLDDGRMDADAAKVLQRLVRHGHEAYLVGGGVRDLLLGQTPKDFDVATSARPDTVRGIFRNSRVIGRRFRLVHVLYGARKIIETATFRRNPSKSDSAGEDLLIRDDNVFGRADEDAERRDFTINALFYDLQNRQVLDWCGGMADIKDRFVRTIGDPVVRFQEDPVRILRAIKFSARLDLGIEPETYRAIVRCRASLEMAAKPRVFEEILRLLRGGKAHRSFWLAWETGVLDVLLPELSAYLYDTPEGKDRVWALLDQLDQVHASSGGEPPDDVVLLAILLLEPMREACEGSSDRVTSAHDFLDPLAQRLAVPRRITDALCRIMAMLPRIEAGRIGKFSRTGLFPLAQEVLEHSQAVSPESQFFALDLKPTRRRRSKKTTSARN